MRGQLWQCGKLPSMFWCPVILLLPPKTRIFHLKVEIRNVKTYTPRSKSAWIKTFKTTVLLWQNNFWILLFFLFFLYLKKDVKFKRRTFCHCIQWTKYNSKFYFKAAVSRPRKTWLVQIPLGTQWRLILFCAARDLSRSVIIVKTSFETEPTDETGRLSGGCVIYLDKHNMKRHTQKTCRGLIFRWKGLNISKQIWCHNMD